MFAVGFKHSYFPHQWSLKGVRDAYPAFSAPMRCCGFVGRPTRVARNPYRSCFQSFTPAERD
ncbi:hypothetical protein YSA_01151 [Pseudomonas putida ND6]|uniref:Uncharacterized protein n=1 Tax=Pseudomonas putida ND6 TaxID=231023 RepID=I3UPI1_PSEPU|nr:hypothetical protein YSA_01151 [Pseudomonas putida ND6]